MQVLVAENDLTSRTMLSAVLNKFGYEAVACSHGMEAWQVMQKPEAPSLAILGWTMPDMSGIELCRRIRATKEQRPPDVIMLTSQDENADIEAGLEAGMAAHVARPINAPELLETIEEILADTSATGVNPPEEDVEAEPSEAAIFRQTALKQMDGDTELLIEAAEMFIEDRPAWLRAIRDAVSQHDCEALVRSAHSLKGAVSNFGARPAREAALRLELMGREKNLDGAEEALMLLEAQLLRLEPHLAGIANEELTPCR